MLREHIVPQSEVIRAISLEDSQCCEVPHRPTPVDLRVAEASKFWHAGRRKRLVLPAGTEVEAAADVESERGAVRL